uniref:GPN-loop GTPase n=1 Tax=Gallus gallus TaxID=9031 RepID=A0A8V0XUT7_CHICK
MAAAGGTAAAPVCVLVLGMAGSGKTTFVQCLAAHLHGQRCPPYVINLDPAVHELPFPANIDIRDTVKYKEVMKHVLLLFQSGDEVYRKATKRIQVSIFHQVLFF